MYGGTLTLAEYKNEINNIKKISFEMFKSSDTDCVYEVILNFRDNSDSIAFGVCSRIFKNFSSMERYIINELKYLADEEDISNRAYWSATKFTLCDGEYQEDINCCFSVNMELISVNLHAVCNNNFWKGIQSLTALEFKKHNYLLTRPKNIDVPYKIGDILKINAKPFAKDFYVVYGGEGFKDERLKGLSKKWDSHYHWCIYESEDRNGLWIDDLSNDCFTDYVHFECCPLNISEKSDSCTNEKLIKASTLLKSNPNLWYKLVEVKENIAKENSNLDSYILK